MFVNFTSPRNVFAQLDALARQVDATDSRRSARGFDGLHGLVHASREWYPRLEVSESADAWTLTGDLPGFAPGDVAVTFDGGLLTISGQQKTEEGSFKAVLQERVHSSFSRQLRFEGSVDVEGIQAVLADGVLTLTVPKAARPKAITVEVRG